MNCSNFDVSLAFYQRLGFKVVLEFDEEMTFGETGLGPILRLPDDCDGRAALLALSDQPGALRLDLIEWKKPIVNDGPAPNLARRGFGRICLKVLDTDRLHRELIDAGHMPYTPPGRIRLGGSNIKIFCVEDPDGVVLEFMEFIKD
ncbi:VOC family protein [Rhizobium sp. TH2]|uniref:VOC family protein n=1 Tax=Rhizobium sp. TH2 TaxID=2775403 RepID=UPI0021589D3E|nr:VOC family protein [Rhizobium sp. TH2]UVC08848.1 VOC family protein [Rhizobium sp. TH2]